VYEEPEQVGQGDHWRYLVKLDQQVLLVPLHVLQVWRLLLLHSSEIVQHPGWMKFLMPDE
jgi:hypothetical protein